MAFFEGLHSGLRWLLLLAMILAVGGAYASWKAKGKYGVKNKMINLVTMILMHTQLLIGFILYFGRKHYEGFSHMDIPLARFLAIEHMIGMLVAITLVTIGRKRAEASESDTAKHRKILLWYGIALLLVLISIPWPFRSEAFGQYFGWF